MRHICRCEDLTADHMKFPGGLSALHLAEEEAIAWLGMQSTR